MTRHNSYPSSSSHLLQKSHYTTSEPLEKPNPCQQPTPASRWHQKSYIYQTYLTWSCRGVFIQWHWNPAMDRGIGYHAHGRLMLTTWKKKLHSSRRGVLGLKEKSLILPENIFPETVNCSCNGNVARKIRCLQKVHPAAPCSQHCRCYLNHSFFSSTLCGSTRFLSATHNIVNQLKPANLEYQRIYMHQ